MSSVHQSLKRLLETENFIRGCSDDNTHEKRSEAESMASILKKDQYTQKVKKNLYFSNLFHVRKLPQDMTRVKALPK